MLHVLWAPGKVGINKAQMGSSKDCRVGVFEGVNLEAFLDSTFPPLCNHVTLTFLLETVGCTVVSKRAGNRAAQPNPSSNPQPAPEFPIEHVQEFKVVWSRKKKFHTVPVERARAHVSMRFALPVLCMHSCGFEVLRSGGAIPPPPLLGGRGRPSVLEPKPAHETFDSPCGRTQGNIQHWFGQR